MIKHGQMFTGHIIKNWLNTLKFSTNNNYIDIWIKEKEISVFIMMIALMIIKYYMESSSELIMVILSKECNKYGLLLRDLMIALSDKIKSKNHKSIQLRVLLSNSSNSEIKKPHFDRETNIILSEYNAIEGDEGFKEFNKRYGRVNDLIIIDAYEMYEKYKLSQLLNNIILHQNINIVGLSRRVYVDGSNRSRRLFQYLNHRLGNGINYRHIV